MKRGNRDEFPAKIKDVVKLRAAFICSNPACRKSTVAPDEATDDKILYIGEVAHICAAAVNGPRYKVTMTQEERISIDNAIFLCSNCADMIDDNGGVSFPESVLRDWKRSHEQWIAMHLNKSNDRSLSIQFAVRSENQSGGITAGVVNLNS